MPTSEKLLTFLVTVLDIASEKVQGVQIETLLLSLEMRQNKLGILSFITWRLLGTKPDGNRKPQFC